MTDGQEGLRRPLWDLSENIAREKEESERETGGEEKVKRKKGRRRGTLNERGLMKMRKRARERHVGVLLAGKTERSAFGLLGKICH